MFSMIEQRNNKTKLPSRQTELISDTNMFGNLVYDLDNYEDELKLDDRNDELHEYRLRYSICVFTGREWCQKLDFRCTRCPFNDDVGSESLSITFKEYLDLVEDLLSLKFD
jgi:hypothetical protein